MWANVGTVKWTNKRLDARWLMATDYLVGPRVLRFIAQGDWEPFSGIRCGPDGSGDFALAPDRMVVSKGNPGCLIGKLGGSSASTDEAGNVLFSIGSHAVISVPDRFAGPLFIGFNLERSQIGLHIFTLDVTVEWREWPFAQAPPAG